MIDRRKKIAGKPTARKKAKRPVAARGKTTRREAGRRAMKEFVKNLEMKGNPIRERIGAMSPGKLRAITGKTAIGKKTMRASDMPARFRPKAMQSMGMTPAEAKNAGRMAGQGAIQKAAMSLAKKIAGDKRISSADVKSATAMLKRAMQSMKGK